MQRPMLPAAVFAVLGAGALLSQHQAVAQTIRYVDNIRTCDDLGPCYPKIMDAISAAEPSDTIEVFPGVYHEAVVFKSGPANIVLKAHIEALKPVIAPPGGQDAVYIEATPGVQLRNFVLEAPDANAVFAVAGASRGLVLDGNLITATYAFRAIAIPECTVTNNTVLSGAIHGDLVGCLIEGNTIAGYINLIEFFLHPAVNTVRHNIFRGGGISINSRSANSNTIESNFVSGGGGIQVNTFGPCPGCSSNLIQGNTSIENGGCDIGETNPNPGVHSTWRNNRFGTKCGTADG